MKITSITNAYDIYVNKPAISRKKTIADEKKDDLNVSNKAREFQSVLRTVANSSDIREDKVASIKNQITNGTYNINAENVADKIISKLY